MCLKANFRALGYRMVQAFVLRVPFVTWATI